MNRILRKRMAVFLVLVMLLSMFPASSVQAEECASTETVTMEATEVTTEIVTEEYTDVVTEMSTEVNVTETATEVATEEITIGEKTTEVTEELTTELENVTEVTNENVSEVSTEEEDTETMTEAPTEVATETSSEENTTEITTEISSEENVTEITTEEKTTEATTEVTTEVTTEEESSESTTEEKTFEKNTNEEIPNEQALVDGDTRTVYNDGSWGEGYRWYIIDDDGSKKYVFCLNHGKTMTSGVYTGMISSIPYDEPYDMYRISTAIAYFDATGDYATAQRVIWNMTDDAKANTLMTYINHGWELNDVNPDRAPGSASFASGLSPIYKYQATNATVLQNLNKTKSKGFVGIEDTTNAGYYTRTFTVGGAAWKYFANKESIKSVVVDMDGNTYSRAKASVATNGAITVSFAPDTGKGDSINTPLAVIFSIDYKWMGANSYTFIDMPDGLQDLTYAAPKNAPGYFAFLVYTEEREPDEDEKYAYVKINKVDEYGTPVTGAEFRLVGTSDEALENGYDKIISAEDVTEIKLPGNYHLSEYATPGSEYVKSDEVIRFTARRVTEGSTTKILITDRSGAFTDLAEYTYTYENKFQSGNAQIVKYGNVLVSYTDGKFVYEKRLLSGVNFDFYAAEDIYANEVKVFSAGEKITTGKTWGNKDK